MRQSELRKAEAGRLRDLSDEQWSAVEALTRAMMNKFLHPTLQAIKAAAAEGDIGEAGILPRDLRSAAGRGVFQVASTQLLRL